MHDCFLRGLCFPRHIWTRRGCMSVRGATLLAVDALPLLDLTGGPIAQRLEQQTHNLLVPGSNPGGPTNPHTVDKISKVLSRLQRVATN